MSYLLRLLTKNERFAQVAHQKWAICSGRSPKMSEWANRSFFWDNRSIAPFWAKHERFAQKTDEKTVNCSLDSALDLVDCTIFWVCWRAKITEKSMLKKKIFKSFVNFFQNFILTNLNISVWGILFSWISIQFFFFFKWEIKENCFPVIIFSEYSVSIIWRNANNVCLPDPKTTQNHWIAGFDPKT